MLMLTLRQVVFVALLAVPTSGKPVWTPTHAQFDRRLDVETVSSHANADDHNCVVGGYNTDAPTHIYVGGPCSELSANNTPSPNFRWVEMFTFYSDLEDPEGNTAELVPGGGVVSPADADTHAKVAVGGYFGFMDPEISMARIFSSTTSYLAKSTLTFNTMDFVTEQKSDGSFETVDDVCIEKCCAADCTCDSGCPTTQITANAGDYKYNIFAAAYDEPGASGNGWARTVDKYGEGTPKILRGFYNVYQAVDFTNMQADKLTITGPDGSSTTYSEMSACSLANLTACTAYPVSTVLVEDDLGFSEQFSFPTTYNRGTWTWSSTANKVVTSVSDTKTVQILMLKPDAAWLFLIGMAGKSVVYIEYKFNITGITAAETAGTWMAYDPTVNNAQGSNAAANNPATASGSISSSFFLIRFAAWSVATWIFLRS